MTMYNTHMITAAKREIKEVRQGDPNFMLTDGFINYPRAMIHVTPECPKALRDEITWAINNGYLKCVAYVQGKELSWQELTK
jgi:hypothetical protein